jgi:MtrB/PioB family decaheme-associated outer membrane protein
MKMRAELLVTCAASAFAIGLGLASPVLAADTMPLKAPEIVAPAWWYEGFAEIGGRFFLNNPDKRKLGLFYEYRDLRPGVFGDFLFGAHKTGPDPLDIEAWGKNIGWNDQAFGLDIYKPGTYYLTLGWDETPHVFGTGRTTYSGGNVLSTPCYPTGAGNICGGGTANANTNAFVGANSHDVDLKYRRDTASAAFRWTPTDNWDVNVDYSHMHRDGTQPLSAVTFTDATTRASTQLPKPVDDTTQDSNLKAEYAGSAPWGKPFNVALGYGFSSYTNNVGCGSIAGVNGSPGSSNANCLTFQNPWVGANTLANPLWNRYSLPPDNQAHNLSVSGGVGLPFNSRYMGTFQYTWMEQNETFLTSTINPLVTPGILPRSSLNGDARTTLANNVLNTQITPELTSTLRYRYYDYHSNQAPMTITGLVTRPDTSAVVTAETASPVNFTKQNATGELVYRPWKWLNVGGIYEWEQWRHEYGDARDVVTLQEGALTAVTNENSVKAFADAKLWGWSTLRTSLRYGERRFDGNYLNNIPGANADGFRTVDLQDRNSTIVKTSWDINVTSMITFTPNGGYRLDDYPANGVTSYGITRNESWNAGGDISWVINPAAALYVSYMHEDGTRELYQRNLPSTLLLNTRDVNDVFIVGGKFTVIPEKLFLNANYTYSRGTSRWSSGCGPGGCFDGTAMPTFPDTHNTNHRIDAQAKYMLDPMRSAGLLPTAQPYVKFRVIYERNSNDSWQNVEQQLGWAVNSADATTSRAVFLGMPNPNYDVVVGMASFGVKW